MSFISWQYALFLPAVALLYWRLPQRGRIWLLLAASYAFYGAWDLRFLALLLTSTCVDFFCGLGISGTIRPLRHVVAAATLPALWLTLLATMAGQKFGVSAWILGAAWAFPFGFVAFYRFGSKLDRVSQSKVLLWLSIGTNLSLLGFFKYFNFFADSLFMGLTSAGASFAWTPLHIILPIAISFYTFQSICYSVDIYRRKAQPITDYPTFAAYLSFFPQLIAGPIERPAHLIPQFLTPRQWSTAHFHTGARLVLGGLFKKVFVADNCAIVANYAFDPNAILNAPWALLGLIAFAVQIYGDFSGYTDIARGSARWLGIELSNNFRYPYFAQNPSDFWRRWHITLSTWFRDYVYIPLGGSRGSEFRTMRNLFVTMLAAGLWHGASWNFIFWGAYHGTLLVIWHVWSRNSVKAEVPDVPRLADLHRVFGMVILTLFGWAIFRCKDVAHLIEFMGAFGRWSEVPAGSWVKPMSWIALHAVPLLLIQLTARSPTDELDYPRVSIPVRGVVYSLVLVAVASSAVNDIEFIYFQF